MSENPTIEGSFACLAHREQWHQDSTIRDGLFAGQIASVAGECGALGQEGIRRVDHFGQAESVGGQHLELARAFGAVAEAFESGHRQAALSQSQAI